MGKNLVYKILEKHLVEGELKQGNEIGIRIDQTLTQDATGTMAYLQLESIGIDKVKTDLSVSYVDHNTVQEGFENFDDHRYLQSVAAKFGLKYSRAGNGVCHQVHLERFGKPGKTLLGSDSHTPTGGGVGMIAMGAGGLDVAVAMAGGPFYLTCPKVVKVYVTGKLEPWVAAKDVILKVLEILTTKGNVGCMVEYSGPGLATLTVPERATITNMGAELGVTTSVFPSDEVTKSFLLAQNRVDDWMELSADADAEYDRVIELDLSTLVPRLAGPHSPDNIMTVQDVAGIKVDQVCIGSCTNASYKDLMTVAKIMKGKHCHPETSFVVSPGSRQVYKMISDNGALSDLIAAGARIMEPSCGFCIGMGQAPGTNAVCFRTNNRNFFGRSGTKSANVYLCSPETAAVAAIEGKAVNPMDYNKEDYPEVNQPESFVIDDKGILNPPGNSSQVEILRGPNIGAPPKNDALPESINGKVLLKVGDKITTDHIMPAGARLKYRSNIPKYSQFVFEPVDEQFSTKAEANKDSGLHNIIVGGLSYGQGSSREHAAICPMYLGVKVVLAKSLERIHTANLINFGIVPLTFKNENDYDSIDQEDALEITGIREALQNSNEIIMKNTTKGTEYVVTHVLSRRQLDLILAGGTLNYMKEKG